jgi:uncharacterized protein involved in exopolysaccharide biosynthesis
MRFRRKIFLGLVLLLAGVALCGAGLWMLVSPAQYVATARIKVTNDVADTTGNGQGVSYDPYFIQTTFEVIQSPLVLSNVVVTLNLNIRWADKYGGGTPLTTLNSVRIIQKHLRLAPVRNTKLISISYQSDDPNEAAAIANAIGKAYQDYWLVLRRQSITEGLQTLTEQFQKQELEIKTKQEQLEQMRQQLSIPTPEPPDELLKTNYPSYFQAKRDLRSKAYMHKLFGAKIEAIKTDSSLPMRSMIQITDPAEPPKAPVGPNRILGAVLLVIGLVSSSCGAWMLKSSRYSDSFRE